MKQRSNKYLFWWLTVLVIIACFIALFVLLKLVPGFFAVVSKFFGALAPILVGVLFAYLLNPLVKMFEQVVVAGMVKKSKKPERTKKLGRALAILFALVIGGIILYGLFYMVLPQLYDTLAQLVNSFPTYMAKAQAWILDVIKDNETLRSSVEKLLEGLEKDVTKLLGGELIKNLQNVMTGVTSIAASVVTTIFNIVLGVVASVYMLWSKEKFQSHAKRLVVATCRPRFADWLLRLGREAHRIFSGFIVGKIIESILIGILCYIGMLILGLPFPILISVVVGVSNVIPMFGPIIGAVPCALLILIVNPLQAVYFVIFDIVLQQLDGNVIGPKILGDSIGLSGFWVLFAITVFGNLFGLIGMLLGLPFFALLYIIVRDAVVGLLEKKNKPLEAAVYYDIATVEELPVTPMAEELTDEPPEEEATYAKPASGEKTAEKTEK